MATITLRVDDRTKDDLDALARSRDTTISDLLRPLVDGLTGRPAAQPGNYPVHLSPVERRMLSMLHQILGTLDPASAEIRRRHSEVLDAGYAAEYEYEFAAVDSGLTVRDCELVHDILDMFSLLGSSVDKLGSAAGDRLGQDAMALLAFRGFDLNDPLEGAMLGYARYLLATGRWTSLAGYFDKHDGGDSHRRNLPAYQRMLEVYQPLFKAKAGRGFTPEHYLLDSDELAQVAQAAVHPDNRQGTRP